MNSTSTPSNAGGATGHLSSVELARLLADDNGSTSAIAAAATHLECCETCQLELTALAGDEQLWRDASELLSGERAPRWEPDLSQSSVLVPENCGEHAHADESMARGDGRPTIEEQVLKQLGAPRHPEMLGRLGRYDIESIIGRGGMGIVLKAHDSELNRPIAIKLLAPHISHVGAARERFAREGRAAAAVVHEHVVAIYNVEADGALPFLIMQYVPGRSLEARVAEDGQLGVEELLRIGMQSAAGLAAAHAQGLVHRDVKPSNILLEDTVERAVLTDFGLARAMDDASLTQTGILAGTPHYMSPEQAMGDAIDHRSDLFSLGAVLYFMATGHPPFRASGALAVLHRICQDKHRPVWQVNKDVPAELSDLIDRLLEKKPGRRLATAEDVRAALAALLSDVQRHGLARQRGGAWRARRRKRTAIAVAVAGAVAAVTGVVAWLGSGTGTGGSTQAVSPPQSPVTAASAAATEIDAEAIAGVESAFFDNLDAARKSLDAATTESVFLQHGEDGWRREVEAIERDLDRIEANDR